MSRLSWVRGAAAMLVGLVAALQIVGVAVPQVRPELNTVCLTLLNLTGGAFALRAGRGADGLAWRMVALGQALTVAANISLGTATSTGDSFWFWLGAGCGMSMYLAFGLAAVMFPAQRLRGWQRVALAGEALAVLGCGFMFVWYFVLQPHLQAPDRLPWPLTLGFPIGDLLLLCGISTVVLRGGVSAAARPLALLTVGLSIFLASDAALGAIGDDGNHATGPLAATVTNVVSATCVALAALWQATTAGPDKAPGTRRPSSTAWFSYLPPLAVALGLLLMVTVTVREGRFTTWGGLVVGLIVVTAGVSLRQLVSLHDSHRHETVDPLTGLTNRVGLNRQLDRAVRRGEPIALLLVDLDGFKAVNDSHGHHTGDLLLVQFATILRSSIRGGDLACRIGGDEFVILQRAVTAEADAVALARRVLGAAAANPLHIGEHTVTARASIGAALAVRDDAADDLRHRADIAMYQAKRAGAHDVVLYRPGMVDRRADDAALGRDLEAAVSSGQLRVLYQPLVDLATGTPLGVEALVRWNHPLRGVVGPLDFIPVAEHTGAITGVGRYVLEQSCRDVQAWSAGSPLYASVNLSARQLQDPALVPDVLEVLRRTGLDPHRLILEITESAIVDDRVAIPAIETLRAHGIRVAIDDFGTGYSSLQYLSRLPVDILKIDRSFVAEIDDTGNGSAITETVVRLAQVLGLATVAEGIETPAQAEELRRLGCSTGQGFLYARPMPASDIARFLADQPSLVAEGPRAG